MLHWLSTAFSTYVLHSQHGNGYQWSSGPGANFGEVTVIGVAYGAFRRVNCHQHRCWRIGRHHVDGSPYVVCGRHHPAVPARVTAEHIAEAHEGSG